MTLFYSMEKKCFYDDEYHQDIPSDAVEMSKEYHQSLHNELSANKFIAWDREAPYAKDYAPITNEQLAAINRTKRDRLLSVFDSKLYRNQFYWDTLTPAQRDERLRYRQLLLDVPNQIGFPENIDWPPNPMED